MEFSSLKNNIILECEKTEDRLMHTWYPNIINIFADKNAFTAIKPDRQESFYNCVTTLISTQVITLMLFYKGGGGNNSMYYNMVFYMRGQHG